MTTKIKDLFHYRDLLFNLTMKELKLKYKNSIIGFLWSFLNPILLLIVYTFAFKIIIRMQIENFPIFVFTALLPWMFVSGAVTMSANSIINNQNLVKKVYFPRIIIPLSIVLSNFVTMLINFVILFLGLIFFKIPFTSALFFLPLALIPTLLITIGLGLLFSTITVKFRDISHLIEIFFMVWFYLTPIIYDAEMIPEPYNSYIKLNPLTLIVEMYRSIVIDGMVPNADIFWGALLYSLCFLLIGYLVFNKRESRLAEEL